VLAQLLAAADAVVIEFGQRHWHAAVMAWQRFGKGRHAAGLNFGDCLSYASRPTEWNHPTSVSGDRGEGAPQTQMWRKRQSWMVQRHIRLLTGRFHVRILVAEPFELVLDLPAASFRSVEPPERKPVGSSFDFFPRSC
jgi:hypothetical protein